MEAFESELKHLLRIYNYGERCNTHETVLARYLMRCLEAYDKSIILRDQMNSQKLEMKIQEEM